MRVVSRSFAQRAFVAMIVGAIGVVGATPGCGRLGYDLEPPVDASLDVTVRSDGMARPPGDASVTPDAPDLQDDGSSPPGDAAPDGPTCSVTCTNDHGTTTCDGATCTPVCATGFDDCDGNANNGCEANLQADPMHCRSCTGVCVVDSGSAICTGGVCGTSSCATGTGDCDGVVANGCETNLDTSTANCRFCGNACTFAHAAASCAGGVCKLGACTGSFADCDGIASSGCEADLSSTTAHCGTCGTACTNGNGSTSCAGSVCKPVCNADFGDCDGNPKNGCETSLTTISDCGICGKVCISDAGTPTCNAGACTTTCDLSGTWAIKVVVAVTWPAVSMTLAGGSGTFNFWARMIATQSGNTLPSTLLLCGISVPDFASSAVAGNEPYGITFPATLFDHSPASFLPNGPATVTLSATTPGSTFSLPTLGFLVGLTMTNPTTDGWPIATAIMDVDIDGDTKRAVTAPYKSGGSYLNVPLDLGKSARTDKSYLASRMVGSYSGTFSDCSDGSGTASVSSIDERILGCELVGGGDCSTTQSTFVDSNKPVYTAGAGTLVLKKIAAGASCTAVRAALP